MSLTYGLIKNNPIFEYGDFGEIKNSEWTRLFSLNVGGYDIQINEYAKPPKRKFNDYSKNDNEDTIQEQIINDLWDKFKNHTWQDMVEYTHNNCGEWREVFMGKNVRVAEIGLDDVFDALSKNFHERERIREKIENQVNI